MRALSASELLTVWERGLAQHSVQRALALLVSACPETPQDELARLSIGQRDGKLLALREWMFGAQLVSLATCAECGERLELAFDVADIRATPDAASQDELSLAVDGIEVHFRLPNSMDLLSIAASEDVDTSRQGLIERCILTVTHEDNEQSADRLPRNVVDAVIEQMSQVDPQADVQLDLTCPACDHRWQAAFDIVSFFWSEIDNWAHHTLYEVHLLASAYGWRETDILNLSPWRRQLYLDMVNV